MSYECKTDYVDNDNINPDENNQMISGVSETSDNILFNNEEDLILKDATSSVKNRVKYFGIVSDSEFSAIINITSSAIGRGCFNFPSILADLGLPLTTIIFVFVSLSIYYTIDLLRRFVVDTKRFSFALMTFEILGNKWLKIYCFSSLIFYLSIEIDYISQLYSIFSNVVTVEGVDALIINGIYFLVTIILEISICSYIAKIQKIHLLSIISLLLFLIILIGIIMQGIYRIVNDDKFEFSALIKPDIKNKLEFFFEIMTYTIKFVYGFSYHSSYPILLSNLKNIDEYNTKRIHIICLVFIAISYFLITFFGNLLLIPLNVILSAQDKTSPESKEIIFFKIIICLFMFGVIPLRFVVIRDNYCSLIDKKNQQISFKTDLIIVSLCIIFCNVISYITNENLIQFNINSNFIGLFAGIFGVIISFILPVINYIGANGRRKVKSIIGYILSCVFCTIGIFSVGHSIYGIFIKNKFKEEESKSG
jgi:uncharacterized membrane protein (DUF485 family)